MNAKKKKSCFCIFITKATILLYSCKFVQTESSSIFLHIYKKSNKNLLYSCISIYVLCVHVCVCVCVRVCVYVYAYIHMHSCSHACTHAYTHTHTRTLSLSLSLSRACSLSLYLSLSLSLSLCLSLALSLSLSIFLSLSLSFSRTLSFSLSYTFCRARSICTENEGYSGLEQSSWWYVHIYMSFLQKSPIKETIFCKRDP